MTLAVALDLSLIDVVALNIATCEQVMMSVLPSDTDARHVFSTFQRCQAVVLIVLACGTVSLRQSMASRHTIVATMWISVELVPVLRTILRVCDERCLQTLIRLIMVAQQILQLFLLHL